MLIEKKPADDIGQRLSPMNPLSPATKHCRQPATTRNKTFAINCSA